MKNDILVDFAALCQKFEGARDLQEIKAWEKDIHKYLFLSSLAGNAGIKILLDPMKARIEEIKQSLLESDSRTLPDCDRNRIIDERNMIRNFVDSIENAPKRLEEFHDRILNELRP